MVVANLFFILESTSIKLTTKKWPENQLSLDLNKNKNEIPILKKKRFRIQSGYARLGGHNYLFVIILLGAI